MLIGERPPLKKEALLISLFKGKTGLSGKGFVYERMEKVANKNY
jgi:hypothetical protein